MNKLILTFLIAVLFAGCQNSAQDQTLELLKEHLKAIEASIHKDASSKSIQLDFKVPDLDTGSVKMNSFAAYYYYKRMDLLNSKYDSLVVKLSDNSSSRQKSYSISSIRLVDSILTEPVEYLFNNYDSAYAYQCIDSTMISREDFAGITNVMGEIDSAYGKATDYKVAAFGFSKLKNSGAPVIVLEINVFNGTYNSVYTIWVLEQSRKIGFLKIN